MTDPSSRDLRGAFGRFMTGVTIVTTTDETGRPLGFTANSFTSVSLDPPLLLVCPAKAMSAYQTFARCTYFAVNVLSDAQEEAASIFASYKGDRFAKVPHTLNAQDVPLIDGAIAQFSCRSDQLVDAGDHAILIGEVNDFSHSSGAALGYADGAFFRLPTPTQNAA